MRLEELRIGNWLNHKDDWSYRQSEQDFKEFNFQWNEYDWYALGECRISLNVLEFIPLTEEWLVKFGFEKVIYESDETGYGTDYELDIKGVGCISYSDDFSCALFGSKESSKHELGFLPNWDNCKHVHSLQNLYFALTGEELKIKE
jgi:hypothetical protein